MQYNDIDFCDNHSQKIITGLHRLVDEPPGVILLREEF